jgi:hypothetical protein
MHHADKTVTVYSKKWDEEKGVDSYRGTVLNGVSFFPRIATAVSTDGLTAACEAALRVPLDIWSDDLDITNSDLAGEEALLQAPANRAELDKLCPYVFTVEGVTRNLCGKGAHVKVVCK